MTGVRFLFRVTLRRLDLAAEIYHLREPQKLVMSQDETRRLLAVREQPQGACRRQGEMFTLIYGIWTFLFQVGVLALLHGNYGRSAKQPAQPSCRLRRVRMSAALQVD